MAVVLATGSSRGIGFGIAKAFASVGENVVLNGKSDAVRLSEAVVELGEQRTIGVLADVSDVSACDMLFTKTEATFGPVEILVNNAGLAHFGLFQEMTPDEIYNIVSNNLFSTINATHRAVPSMVKAKSGVIINITSVWGVTGASCEAVYSAAKAGVIGFTKALAKELGPSGIRVNAIACGAFETRMNERLTADERECFIDGISLGRFGEPREVGDLAVFLASSKASYLTGQIIALDGGFNG